MRSKSQRTVQFCKNINYLPHESTVSVKNQSKSIVFLWDLIFKNLHERVKVQNTGKPIFFKKEQRYKAIYKVIMFQKSNIYVLMMVEKTKKLME